MRPKIGLVLGGGGSRGIAHIGVLEVLVRENIPIDLIVGTSMGAIVGTLFALGIKPNIIAQQMRQLRGNNLFSVNLFSAAARQRLVEQQLAEGLKDKTFDDLKIPTIVMAVDLLHGREIALTQGPLMSSVLASSAMPGIFPPVAIDGMQLADGGVIDSLATHIAFEQGADKIIAVDIQPPLEKDTPWVDPLSAIFGFELPFGVFNNSGGKPPGMLLSLWRSVRVMIWYLHETRLAAYPPDVLLRPAVESYGTLDFKNVDGPLQAGIDETEQQLAAIKALLAEET